MKSDYSKPLSELFNIITDYIENNIQSESKIIDYKDPSSLKKILNLGIPENGIAEDELLNEVRNYLKYSVKTGNKQFLNQFYSGFTLPGFIGEIITALTNTSMYTYEVAPVATLIEKEIISEMLKKVGFNNGSGIFVTGGSNANLIAMFSAVNKAFPERKNKGNYKHKTLTAFVSEESHYSFGTAANLLGIGADNLIKIKSDSKGIMMPTVLEKKIIESLNRNERPFFIAGTAGTTMLGAFDNFEEINRISKKYNCHFHIDGSVGGSLILSKKRQKLFKGIEGSDSFAWDPHKLMNIPLIASVILFKDKTALKSNLSRLNTDYIYHENEENDYDLGESSIQCGRRNDALKVWLSWKYMGHAGFENHIEHLFDLTKYVELKISEHDNLELMSEVQTLTVCFRYNSGKKHDLNSLNLDIREDLRKRGKSMINYGYIGKDVTIRFAASSSKVTRNDIDIFFRNFFEAAENIFKKLN